MLITAMALLLCAVPDPPRPDDPDIRIPVRTMARLAAVLEHEPDFLARAIAAHAAGDLDEARRDFAVAAALERDAGRMPTQAAYGLALVLEAQGKHREAARVLERLADDAAARHDDEAEASALVDARYLNAQAHRAGAVRENTERLTVLASRATVSATTRRRITTF